MIKTSDPQTEIEDRCVRGVSWTLEPLRCRKHDGLFNNRFKCMCTVRWHGYENGAGVKSVAKKVNQQINQT
ncbi:hypothetical protein O9929_16175 [Vibrio lentus]|nr:hypothetical protein [Vibrio lentus]